MSVVTKWQRLVEDQQTLRLLVVLVSLLWSAVVLLQNPVLNDDAYGYLRAALLFREEGLAAVFDRYGWYGYSVLIGVLDAGLPGGVKAAAHVLDAALLALLVLAFVDCAALLQPAPRTRLLAAGILLFPLLNEMRFYVVRDFGFWAFTLLSLSQLERQRRQPGWWPACGWCLALLAATLFRLEALLLAAFTPLGAWRGTDWRTRWQPYVALVLIAGLLLLLAQFTGADLPARLQYAYRFTCHRSVICRRALPRRPRHSSRCYTVRAISRGMPTSPMVWCCLLSITWWYSRPISSKHWAPR